MDNLEEILTITMEECAEVIQACSKILRYGADSEWNGITAQKNLEKEFGDLQCMMELLHEHDMISYTNMDECALVKREKLKEWSNLVGL